MQHIINNIIQKLKEPLPGETAQYIMAPSERGKLADYGDASKFKMSAVLLVICRDEDNELFIPLTERFAYDGVHSGQVSLPGGKFEPADGDLTATALRECEEEIGLKDNVQILGTLSRLYIPVSNFLVQPVVAYCTSPHVFMTPHVREVKQIVRLYLDALMDEALVKDGMITVFNNGKRKAPYFEIEGLKVWGATAMILSEFKVLLKTIS
ncbi:MAG: CoA pyrophosphatase [Bacteroidetes bacterium]|nr:CoA pyrophosphatase [Bacteroidota bacterium]